MAANTILVVEDDRDLADALSTVLEEEGYAVKVAGNGRAALEYLHQAEHPCLILLDVMMPVMDGLQFWEAQHRDPDLATIPTVLMTAAPEMARQLAPVDLLPKPLDFGSLITTVKRCAPRS